MNALRLLGWVSALLWGSSLVQAAEDHHHDHTPLHGGVVVEEKDLNFELVAQPERLQLYLSEHHGEPLNPAKLTAQLTLLSRGNRQEVTLLPVGDHLEAQGNFKVDSQTKVIAVLSGGKVATARFVLP